MQIQISWLLKKPTDLDLHCLQRQGISGLAGQDLSPLQGNVMGTCNLFSWNKLFFVDRPFYLVVWVVLSFQGEILNWMPLDVDKYQITCRNVRCYWYYRNTLTFKVPGRFVVDNPLKYLFSLKLRLDRWFTWNIKSFFLWKIIFFFFQNVEVWLRHPYARSPVGKYCINPK